MLYSLRTSKLCRSQYLRSLSNWASKENPSSYISVETLAKITAFIPISSFDEFAGKEILSERDVQDYHSQYLRIYDELRPQGKEKDNVNDDLIFEIELIKQVEINIDYILMLIKKYHEGHMEDKEIKVSILKSVDASIELRSKKDLIENFIDSLTPSSNVDEDWKKYVNAQK